VRSWFFVFYRQAFHVLALELHFVPKRTLGAATPVFRLSMIVPENRFPVFGSMF